MASFEEICDVAIMLLIIPLVWLVENEWAQIVLISAGFGFFAYGHWVIAFLIVVLLMFVRYVAWSNGRH